MSRHAKPYIKCEKLSGAYRITLMKGGAYGHSLGGRIQVPMGDPALLQSEVIKLVDDVRAANRKVGKQADGNS